MKIINKIIATINNILAKLAAVPAMPVNPKIAATKASIKNANAHENTIFAPPNMQSGIQGNFYFYTLLFIK